MRKFSPLKWIQRVRSLLLLLEAGPMPFIRATPEKEPERLPFGSRAGAMVQRWWFQGTVLFRVHV